MRLMCTGFFQAPQAYTADLIPAVRLPEVGEKRFDEVNTRKA